MRRALLVVPFLAGALLLLTVSVLAPPSRPAAGDLVARFAGPLAAGTADARRIISPDFERAVELRAGGRQLVATGPQGCEPGEKWVIEVVVTQGDVVGKGRDAGHCSGNVGSWTTKVPASGPEPFVPGDASGCATLVTRHGNAESDRFEWCQDLVLEAG